MDIYHRLRADHERQRSLAAAIRDASENSAEMQGLFEVLCAEVEAHAAAEEQTLYAELFALSQDPAWVRHSVVDHDATCELIDGLSGVEMPRSVWLAKFDRLMDCLERHLDEEESVTFAIARSAISPDRAVELGDGFEKLKGRETAAWGKRLWQAHRTSVCPNGGLRAVAESRPRASGAAATDGGVTAASERRKAHRGMASRAKS